MKKLLRGLVVLVLIFTALPVFAQCGANEFSAGDVTVRYCETNADMQGIEVYGGTQHEQTFVLDEFRWYWYDQNASPSPKWTLFIPSDIVSEVFTTASQNTTSGTLSDITGNGSSSTMGVTVAAQDVVQGECMFTADSSGTLPAITIVPTGPSGSTNRQVLLRAYDTSLLGATVTGTLAGLAGASGVVYTLTFETKVGSTPGLLRLQKSVTGDTPSFTIAANSHCTFKIIS